MKITFYGAAGGVTGSCSLVEADGKKILVDCGAFQGGREEAAKNNRPFGFDPKVLDAVVLTHAHFDHCGRLPKLVGDGFHKKIYMTPATRALTDIILHDSINVMETQYQNSGALPFFNYEQMKRMLGQVEVLDYHRWHEVAPGVTVRLHDAGHIFGSAFVELVIGRKSILFSGDLGNAGAPIIRDVDKPPHTDYVVMEATYAGRNHEPAQERETKLEKALLNTHKINGVLLIPAFAVERTQEILWQLHNLADKHKLPSMDFYLDSPLAIKATEVFRRYPSNYDEEANRAYRAHHDFFNFPRLTLCRTVDESKTINTAKSPKVILAGSGMMDGGRILFHLDHYISKPNTTILVVGYQAEKTLGRQILEGAREVRLFGKHHPVNAQVIKINAFSAHADQHALVQWVTTPKPAPKTVFLNHGELQPAENFALHLKKEHQLETLVPKEGQTFELN